MKIAFILPSLANRGPIVFTKYLIDELKTLIKEITIFYFDDVIDITFDIQTRKLSFWKSYRFDDFDIIHTTGARPEIYAAFHCPKNKWVVSMHNYFIEDLSLSYRKIIACLYTFLWKAAFKRCKYMIVSSIPMKNYYSEIIGLKAFYKIIPYGIKAKTFSEIDANDVEIFNKFKKKGYTILGSVGLLIHRKGFHQLLDILKKCEQLAVVLVGDGVERSILEATALKFGVEDRFYICGFRNDSYNYNRYFDVYMHVSYSEGFGLSMLEAMSNKLPVVCSNLDIYKEYFSETDVCFFTPDNIQSLEKAINHCIENLQHFSNASYRLFLNQFNSRTMAIAHYDFYRSIKNGLI